MIILVRSMGVLDNAAKVVVEKQLEGLSPQTKTKLGKNQEELFLIHRICTIIQ